MRRREFIAALSGAMVWPHKAAAQQPGRTYRLGVVAPSGRDAPPIAAFFDELRRAGFVEGQNLTVVPGGFGVSLDQQSELSATLVKAAPDVIVADAPRRTRSQATDPDNSYPCDGRGYFRRWLGRFDCAP